MQVNEAAQKYVDNQKNYDCSFYGDAPQHVKDENIKLLEDLRNNDHYITRTSRGFFLKMSMNPQYSEQIS